MVIKQFCCFKLPSHYEYCILSEEEHKEREEEDKKIMKLREIMKHHEQSPGCLVIVYFLKWEL